MKFALWEMLRTDEHVAEAHPLDCQDETFFLEIFPDSSKLDALP